MNQKWVHLHWSEYFWNTDSGLSEGRGTHLSITAETKRFLTENIDDICSLESHLFFICMCSIRILKILEVIGKISTHVKDLDDVAQYCKAQNANLVRYPEDKGARQKMAKKNWKFGIPWIS